MELKVRRPQFEEMISEARRQRYVRTASKFPEGLLVAAFQPFVSILLDIVVGDGW